eukprot:167128-Chlamydomonas_euryale.AAC.3
MEAAAGAAAAAPHRRLHRHFQSATAPGEEGSRALPASSARRAVCNPGITVSRDDRHRASCVKLARSVRALRRRGRTAGSRLSFCRWTALSTSRFGRVKERLEERPAGAWSPGLDRRRGAGGPFRQRCCTRPDRRAARQTFVARRTLAAMRSKTVGIISKRCSGTNSRHPSPVQPSLDA